jgi:hypothetical protein
MIMAEGNFVLNVYELWGGCVDHSFWMWYHREWLAELVKIWYPVSTPKAVLGIWFWFFFSRIISTVHEGDFS